MQWCSDESYARDLLRRRYDPHVAPINTFVDKLRRVHSHRFIPYVASTFGGTNARLLALFQDPGPMTNPANPRGSGMLCVENDDETAARHKAFLAEYKIDTCDILSWNAYPWYGANWYGNKKNRTPVDELAATRALSQLLSLLPNLEVVMLHGVVAKKAWARLDEYTPLQTESGPDVEPGRVHTSRIHPVDSWHLSPRVVDPETKTPEEIDRFTRELHESFSDAAAYLRRRFSPGYFDPYDPPF
ncbi:MAG: uracil-DNA glycosylase [Rhodococcus sp. (in: high G+C Gram-positive bacteria)]|uniref:uracil-DNA glycosylase n=1 Tax=Rhodococcus sp. TaxID=1831 RepID=UPI003BB596F7